MREEPETARDAVVVVILPDGGRNYLSKLYNDEWMRANGLLALGRAPSSASASCSPTATTAAELPDVVLARTTDRVGAGDRASPAVRDQPAAGVRAADGDALEGIVGSVSEKGLLDRAYRDPSVVERTVGEVMDRPLPTIDVAASLDEAFALLSDGAPAVARGPRRARRRASSPGSTCWSTWPTAPTERRSPDFPFSTARALRIQLIPGGSGQAEPRARMTIERACDRPVQTSRASRRAPTRGTGRRRRRRRGPTRRRRRSAWPERPGISAGAICPGALSTNATAQPSLGRDPWRRTVNPVTRKRR